MTYMTMINLQGYLKNKGFYKGKLDNEWGRLTDAAVQGFLESRSGKLTFDWRSATYQRRIVAVWQLLCLEAGITEVGAIDGHMGPATRDAIEALEELERYGERIYWREALEKEPPLPHIVKSNWPLERDVTKYFGQVGKNQAMLEVPYPHKLAWDTSTTIRRFSIHEKVHDSASRVLNRVLVHYGPERIKELGLDMFGGCLNVRPKRGTKSTYSMHAWGIAIDYDPERNQLKWGRDRARMARPEYDVWWKLWEEEGWVSLGRLRNYDWMHIQAARLS